MLGWRRWFSGPTTEVRATLTRAAAHLADVVQLVHRDWPLGEQRGVGEMREQSVQNRTPILLIFSLRLPSVTATGRWRERGRMGLIFRAGSDIVGDDSRNPTAVEPSWLVQ